MGKKDKKQFDSLAIQLISLCASNAILVHQAELMKDEFDQITKADETIHSLRQKMLYRVLHSCRGMDTGMRTFLELYGELPSRKAMGPYLSKLSKGKTGCFGPLCPGLDGRIRKNVINQRNQYLHEAGQYPNKAQAERLISDVHSYLQTIFNTAY